MIVVVGTPAWDPVDPAHPAGLACMIAMAAAADHAVELVGRTGDDAAGDELVLALSRAGVGHVALLRGSGGSGLEPADVSLGLAYLTGFDVLVVADDVPAAVLPVCADAATFAGARLVVVRRRRSAVSAGLPADATVLVAPGHDEPAFAQMVGRYAVGLAAGLPPDRAFDAATRATGWEHRGTPI